MLLIAEDTDSNYRLVAAMLGDGYELLRAKNGLEAVGMYADSKPDLILMDMKMPVMDGPTAVQEIRKTDPDIPIMALTALAFASDERRALEAGCNAYLTKPLNASQLLETITGLLRPVRQ